VHDDDPLDPVAPAYQHMDHDELEAMELDRTGCLWAMGLILGAWAVGGLVIWRLWQIVTVLL
jgi:hypothetical protein